MKCANCNSELAEGATICGNCGAPVKDAIPDASPVELEPDLPPPSPEYQPVPAADIPPVPLYDAPPEPVTKVEVVSPGGEKNLGARVSSLGVYSLILGIIGLLLSCVGCGGIISIAGAITGYLSLKTTSRQSGTIGLIISGLGIIATLVFVCIYLIFIVSARFQGNNSSY